MIELTASQKDLIKKLNHQMYSVEYIEQWINYNDKSNIVGRFIAAGALGFYSAIQKMEQMKYESDGIDIK